MMYLAYALLTVHMFVGIFLIGLILLQRGRGGGLAGAFGGMGGQSAFGTKAGDIFTKITIGVAVFWILLACVCILVVGAATKNRATFVDQDKAPVKKAPADGKAGAKEEDAVDEKQPEDKKGDEAAGGKKPDNADAKPATANPDAPAGANENDKEQPATPESSETKQPE